MSRRDPCACRWCRGTGKEYVEPNSSHFYRCPDCDGTGRMPELEQDEAPEPYEGNSAEVITT
jgi:DnaJ-class molecular chaperone